MSEDKIHPDAIELCKRLGLTTEEALIETEFTDSLISDKAIRKMEELRDGEQPAWFAHAEHKTNETLIDFYGFDLGRNVVYVIVGDHNTDITNDRMVQELHPEYQFDAGKKQTKHLIDLAQQLTTFQGDKACPLLPSIIMGLEAQIEIEAARTKLHNASRAYNKIQTGATPAPSRPEPKSASGTKTATPAAEG